MLQVPGCEKALYAHQHKFRGLGITFGGGQVREGGVLQWRPCSCDLHDALRNDDVDLHAPALTGVVESCHLSYHHSAGPSYGWPLFFHLPCIVQPDLLTCSTSGVYRC